MLAGTPIGPVHLALAETRLRMLARQGLLSDLRAEIAELERIAAATGSPQALAFAHWGRADLCLHAGDHRGAKHATAVMMRLAREQNSVLLLEEAHRPAVCIALAWGDQAAARQLAEEGRRLARGAAFRPCRSSQLGCSPSPTSSLVPGRRRPRVRTTCWRSAIGSVRRGAAAALCVRRWYIPGAVGSPRRWHACAMPARCTGRGWPMTSTCSESAMCVKPWRCYGAAMSNRHSVSRGRSSRVDSPLRCSA